MIGGTTLAENTNIDTIFTPGNYGTSSSGIARTMIGLPTTGNDRYAFNLKVENSAFNDAYARRQTLQYFNDVFKYVRYGTASNNSWNAWVKMPSRAEMDAVSTFTNFSTDVTWQDATPNTSYNNFLCFGKICVVLFDFTSPSTVTSDKLIATLPTCFRANGRNVGILAKAWNKNETAIIHIMNGNVTLAGTAWEANTRYVGQVVYIR